MGLFDRFNIYVCLFHFGVDGAISTTFMIDFLLVRTLLKNGKRISVNK